MRQDEQERLVLRQGVMSELYTGLYILVLIAKDPYLASQVRILGVLESQRSGEHHRVMLFLLMSHGGS